VYAGGGAVESTAVRKREWMPSQAMLAGPTPEQTAAAHGLVRVLVLEDEYRRAVLTAERDWVRQVVDDLRSGGLTWTREQVRALAEGR
jgi:hypothetical protein